MKIFEFLPKRHPLLEHMLQEQQNYELMYQDLITFYNKHKSLHSDRISDFREMKRFFDVYRKTYRRSDIVTTLLAYARIAIACKLFAAISNHMRDNIRPFTKDTIRYALGISEVFPPENNTGVAGALEDKKLAYAELLSIIEKYYDNLRKRGETPETLELFRVITPVISEYLRTKNIDINKLFSLSPQDTSMSTVNDYFKHYLDMSQTFPIFDGYSFYNKSLNVIFRELSEREKKYQASISGTRVDDLTDDVKVIMSFSDGFSWFDLQTDYSEDEANMMGHCCRDERTLGYGTVYSLRKVTRKSGVTYHDSHVTAMIKDKATYEIKGRGNAKPIPKYHKYLVALLQSPLIEHMVGGGYREENNFKITDLDSDQARLLLEKKPGLGTLDDFAHSFGKDSVEYETKITDTINTLSKGADLRKVEGGYVLPGARRFKEFMDDFGDDSATAIVSILSGDTFLDPYWGSVRENRGAFADFYHDREIQDILLKYVKKSHSDVLKQYLEEAQVSEKDIDWEEFVEDFEITEIEDALNESVNMAAERGAEREMQDEFISALEDFSCEILFDQFDESVLVSILPANENSDWFIGSDIQLFISDSTLEKILSFSIIQESLASKDFDDLFVERAIDGKFTVTEPRYGWGDYKFSDAKELFMDRFGGHLL